jgi:UTP--glucose-1-phosphate uridylyltransferase
MIDLGQLDGETGDLLGEHGFDTIPFSELAERVRRFGADPDRNRLGGPVHLPPDKALTRYPEPGSGDWQRFERRGQAAIEAGEVGAVVLNGGMATRFGGVVKGVVRAVAGRSFLDLKIAQIARAGGGRVPVLLMNSFATERETADHLAGLSFDCEVRSFCQLVSLRLTPEGELFFDASGRPSLHAPGHGDLPFALRRSGELERFVQEGGRILTVSNVDNLGASLDPVVIGMHLESGRGMSVELVETRSGDVGGFPALVDGRLTIVEAFRLPRDFDVDRIPVFNTNSFVFSAESLGSAPELDWFTVEKKVEGRAAVQFERLLGQLTDSVEAAWLLVPREGEASRFEPIKAPDDLTERLADLERLLKARGVLDGD